MSAETPTFEHIRDLYNAAEDALKVAEHSPVKLLVPAQNELRYAGRHVVDAVCAKDDGKKRDRELHKAAKHCKRAIYDVFEAELLFIFESFDQFRKDYREITIAPVINDYASINHRMVVGLRAYVEISREDRENRELFAEKVGDIREELFPLMERLEFAREELNKVVIAQQVAEQKAAGDARATAADRAKVARFMFWGLVVAVVTGVAAFLALRK